MTLSDKDLPEPDGAEIALVLALSVSHYSAVRLFIARASINHC